MCVCGGGGGGGRIAHSFLSSTDEITKRRRCRVMPGQENNYKLLSTSFSLNFFCYLCYVLQTCIVFVVLLFRRMLLS